MRGDWTHQPFLWGTATASHQVEGNTTNDWTRWEDEGHVAHQERSGAAANHWELYEEDFKLLASGATNAYRFSVEWSRIEPQPGHFDEEAIARYRTMVLTMRRYGLEPVMTLYHFTLPQWFSDGGGWLQPEAIRFFERYVAYVVAQMGDLVDWYVTINEPMVYAVNSYLYGIWPPGRRTLKDTLTIASVLVQAHIKAYQVIREIKPDGAIGLAHHLMVFDPWTRTPWDTGLARILAYAFNWRFIKQVNQYQDFLGVNYYTRSWASIRKPLTPIPSRVGDTVSNLGWEVYPHGLYRLLMEAYRRYDRPLLITENGISTDIDAEREAFLQQHLYEVDHAKIDGVPVIGYFHWSFIDNFEWESGFAPHFGLVAVDYDNYRRTPRRSFYTYQRLIQQYQATNRRGGTLDGA